jgi:hypothetical protein
VTRELDAVDNAADRLRDELVTLEARRAAAERLASTTDYGEIDYRIHEQEALRLTEERRALEEGTEAIRTLKDRLAFTILVAAIAYQYDIDPARPARMSHTFSPS